MRPARLTLLVAAVVISLDAATKLVVVQLLTPGRIVHAGPLLRLDLYYNHAGAGNALTGRSTLVSLLAILAVILIAAMAGRTSSRATGAGLGLLLGGGIGNLADRLIGAPGPLRGGVIDWLRPLHSSGSMNLADLAINLGVIVVVFGVFAGSRTRRAEDQDAGPPAAAAAPVTSCISPRSGA